MSAYYEQDGCHNCKVVFCKEEYDSENEYFCTEGDTRPKCGSLFMKEYFKRNSDDYDAWDYWTDTHRLVRPWGICKDYIKKD